VVIHFVAIGDIVEQQFKFSSHRDLYFRVLGY